MVVSYFDKNGKTTENKYEVQDSVFATRVNKQLLTQAVNAYLANQRQSNANTKNRGQVSGGGRKPWKQKGTGRARHGSIRSPIWKGGGVTFGPRNEENYKMNISKKMKKAAIRSALSFKAQNKELAVFAGLDTKKTKDLLNVISNSKLAGKITIVQAKNNPELLSAARNADRIKVMVINELNAYAILNNKNLVILEPALEYINKHWAASGKTVAAKAPEKTKAVKKEKTPVNVTKKVRAKSTKKAKA
jgi:large subunit ribosomal protein L4